MEVREYVKPGSELPRVDKRTLGARMADLLRDTGDPMWANEAYHVVLAALEHFDVDTAVLTKLLIRAKEASDARPSN